MKAVAKLRAQHLRTQGPGSLRKRRDGSDGCARNFQRNLSRGWKGAAHGQQHATGGNIQRSGKLEELFIPLKADSDKNGDGQR